MRILLAGIFVFLTISVPAHAWCFPASTDPGQPRAGGAEKASGQTDLQARIARIEQGLLPAVTIKGQPTQTMSVFDRMKHYKVPGLSVSFFDQGQILWSRTYGFADVGRSE